MCQSQAVVWCCCAGGQMVMSMSGGQVRVENVVDWPSVVQQFLAQRRQRDRSPPERDEWMTDGFTMMEEFALPMNISPPTWAHITSTSCLINTVSFSVSQLVPLSDIHSSLDTLIKDVTLGVKSLGSVRFLLVFLKEVSSAHQVSICLIKKKL